MDNKKIINELLVDTFNRILRIEERELIKSGVNITMNEVHVLEAIQLTNIKTMTNIANYLSITVGSLTTAVNNLVNKGYVKRLNDVNDRRKVFLELTDLANETLKKHSLFHNKMIEEVFNGLNIGNDIVLINALKKVNDFFKEKI